MRKEGVRPPVSNRRKRPVGRALLALSTATLATAAVLPGSSMASPKPTLDEVKKRVDELREDAERAAERSNEYKEKAKSLDRRVETLEADVERQQKEVGQLRDKIGAYAAAQFRDNQMDPSVQLLMSDDPDEFLAQMNSTQAIRNQQGDALRHLQSEQKELAERKAAQKAELARLQEARKQAKKRKEVAKAKVEKAEALLEKLTEEQRRRMEARERERVSRGGGRDDDELPPPTGTGRGRIALDFARAQIGEPYVFGAAGPDSWDCSGLTMVAWQQAGVSLPHSSRSQYAQSAKVSRSELAPGDLVIFYSDMHHVGIYAGSGMVVHAPRPGKSVEAIPMDYMPVTGMVRPG